MSPNPGSSMAPACYALYVPLLLLCLIWDVCSRLRVEGSSYIISQLVSPPLHAALLARVDTLHSRTDRHSTNTTNDKINMPVYLVPESIVPTYFPPHLHALAVRCATAGAYTLCFTNDIKYGVPSNDARGALSHSENSPAAHVSVATKMDTNKIRTHDIPRVPCRRIRRHTGITLLYFPQV